MPLVGGPREKLWFIFPQIAGLGRSAMAQAYAITDLTEAKAYLECAEIVASHRGLSAEQIFGGIDSIKLRSSMTLFAHAAPQQPVFWQVIDQYFTAAPIRRPNA